MLGGPCCESAIIARVRTGFRDRQSSSNYGEPMPPHDIQVGQAPGRPSDARQVPPRRHKRLWANIFEVPSTYQTGRNYVSHNSKYHPHWQRRKMSSALTAGLAHSTPCRRSGNDGQVDLTAAAQRPIRQSQNAWLLPVSGPVRVRRGGTRKPTGKSVVPGRQIIRSYGEPGTVLGRPADGISPARRPSRIAQLEKQPYQEAPDRPQRRLRGIIAKSWLWGTECAVPRRLHRSLQRGNEPMSQNEAGRRSFTSAAR